MRKPILFFALAATLSLLASCNKEQVLSQQPEPAISFDIAASRSTKADAPAVSAVAGVYPIYVSAARQGDDRYYFTNNTVTEAQPSGVNTYYWPSYTLAFFAATHELTVSAMAPSLSYTVAPHAVTAPNGETKELLVAATKQTRAQVSGKDGEANVSLNFFHALSRISVMAKKSSSATAFPYNVKIAGVQLGGFESQGTFTFPAYTTANSAAAIADPETPAGFWWSADNATLSVGQAALYNCWARTADTKVVYGYAPVEDDDAEGAQEGDKKLSGLNGGAALGHASDPINLLGAGNYFYVIPNTSADVDNLTTGTNIVDNKSIYIDLLINVCTVGTGDQVYPATTATLQDGKYAMARVYLGTQQFDAGKSYTITLDFSNGVGAAFSVTNVVDGASTDLVPTNYVADVSGYYNNDNLILGDAIAYTVTVTDWAGVTVDEIDLDTNSSVVPVVEP